MNGVLLLWLVDFPRGKKILKFIFFLWFPNEKKELHKNNFSKKNKKLKWGHESPFASRDQ
jgi:hypothetical protein